MTPKITITPNITSIIKEETTGRLTVTQNAQPVRVTPSVFKVNAVSQTAKLTRPAVSVQMPDIIDGGNV